MENTNLFYRLAYNMKAILFVLNAPNCNKGIIKRLTADQLHGNLTPPSSSELPPLPATVLSRSDCGWAGVSLSLLPVIAASVAI